MRTSAATRVVFCAISFLASWGALAVDPVVSNVQASQRAGTKLVDITYDLADADSTAMTITIAISSDGGTTWTVPCAHASGEIGAGRTPGTGRTIVWDAAADWNGNWSEHMRVRVTADDSAGVPPGDEFVLIPGGTNNGTNPLAAGESYDPSYYPQTYSLTVASFYMGRTEVTKETWDAVRTWGAAHGYTDLPAGGQKAPNHPVHSVSWYDVVKWCNARSEMEERAPCYTVSGVVYRTGNQNSVDCNASASGYRLPTDAEWEYAARGGLSGKRFPWGDTITHSQANYCSYEWYSYDVSPTRGYHPTYRTGEEPYTNPVGSFAANAYGLRDMAGNLWEWCWDWYPEHAGRVLRGGCWGNRPDSCRAGYRGMGSQGNLNVYHGFRACSAAPGQ